jgi:hypothetical protein
MPTFRSSGRRRRTFASDVIQPPAIRRVRSSAPIPIVECGSGPRSHHNLFILETPEQDSELSTEQRADFVRRVFRPRTELQ